MSKYRIMLGVPHGGMISDSTAIASYEASRLHDVTRIPSCVSGPNYNALLVDALNRARTGEFTHFAMIHADIAILRNTDLLWLDILCRDADQVNADFLSVPIAIKDPRGVTSCGIGDPNNEWNPWRRFCINEFAGLPNIFNAKMAGYGDKYLLHNHACCLWDLRKPVWHMKGIDGRPVTGCFNLTEDIRWDEAGKTWLRFFKSEDWVYSRQLWRAGVKSWISSNVTVYHHGTLDYENFGDHGTWRKGDEDTAGNWRVPGAPCYVKGTASEIVCSNTKVKAS